MRTNIHSAVNDFLSWNFNMKIFIHNFIEVDKGTLNMKKYFWSSFIKSNCIFTTLKIIYYLLFLQSYNLPIAKTIAWKQCQIGVHTKDSNLLVYQLVNNIIMNSFMLDRKDVMFCNPKTAKIHFCVKNDLRMNKNQLICWTTTFKFVSWCILSTNLANKTSLKKKID